MADSGNQDELIQRFVGLTGASPADAQRFLSASRGDINNAVTEYYTHLDEGGDAQETAPAAPYTGPRTLDGRPAPASAIPAAGPSSSSSSSSRAAPKRGGITTLGSLGSAPAGGHGHAHDDDDDDTEDEDFDPNGQPRDLFAGGEKSGLAVQDPSRNDPRKLVNDILKKAKANAARPGGNENAAPPPSRFHGSGQTLGGDDTPSQIIPDSRARVPEPEPPQTRVLHLWEDGFSVEDGPLRRFDDPQNAQDLQMIRQGRAPLHLMGVRPDQPVDVQLVKHEENYKPPPKVYKPFSGGGHRLGSPTPGGSSTTTTPAAAPAQASTQAVPEPEIDPSQPTVSLRIQLANGTRLPARFNTTNTIGDVYGFIERAAPTEGRAWVLATTFPNKDHTEKHLQLGDVAEFKRGGTAVQKWK